MARKSTTSTRGAGRRGKAKGITVDLSKVGARFEAEAEYVVNIVEVELKEGDAGDYFSLKLEGTGDHEGTFVYHNASTSPNALWRLRPLIEALGMEIPEGPMELSVEDFLDKTVGISTYVDNYNGEKRVKVEDFFEPEPADTKGAKKDKASAKTADKDDDDDIDLTGVSDADIKKLAKEFEIAGRKVDKLREELGECDPDELREAAEDLGIELGGAEEEEEPEKPAKRGRGKAKAPAKAAGKKGKVKDEPEAPTADEIGDMAEDDLTEVIEQFELDLDLSEHKTLRKKRVALIDALTEEGLIEED